MNPAVYASVKVDRLPDGRACQSLTCSCPGCTEKLSVPVTTRRKPPSLVLNMARRHGWSVKESKRQFLCPQHG